MIMKMRENDRECVVQWAGYLPESYPLIFSSIYGSPGRMLALWDVKLGTMTFILITYPSTFSQSKFSLGICITLFFVGVLVRTQPRYFRRLKCLFKSHFGMLGIKFGLLHHFGCWKELLGMLIHDSYQENVQNMTEKEI